MRPGLGYRQDQPDARDHRFAARPKAAGQIPDEVDHSHLVPAVLHQGPTNSCVGHAWASGIQLGLILDGAVAPELPAPYAIYSWSRAEHGEEHLDEGTYLRTGGKAVQTWGFPALSDWPSDPANVNTPPPHRVYRAAHDRRGMRGYRRISFGDTEGIARALAGDAPVVFGTTIRKGFFDVSPHAVLDQEPGDIAGGHAMLVTGYRTTRVGREFRWLSSWGTGWADGGFCWVTERRMGLATDLWLADFDPNLPRANS